MALGFALGTCCVCGLGLCPRNLLHLWSSASPLGLAALVATGFAIGTHCTCDLAVLVANGFALGTHCVCVLGLRAVLMALGFALGTRCARGLGLCPGYQMDYIYDARMGNYGYLIWYL
jgi:hypothetical protein